MPITSQDKRSMSAGSTAVAFAANFTDWLDSGELIASVTISEAVTTALTLSSKAVSTAELTIKGETAAIGTAAQCMIDATNAVAGTTYTLIVTPTTDSTPPRSEVFYFEIECV